MTLPADETAYYPRNLLGAEGGEHTLMAKRSAFDPRYIVALVRSNLTMIIAVIAATVAIAVVVTLLETPRYTARASIQINDTSDRVLGDKQGDPAEDSAAAAGDPMFLQTQVDILQSRGMAIRVAQKLKLDSDPRFFASQGISAPGPDAPRAMVRMLVVGLLGDHLKVEQLRESRLVTLSFDSTDPRMSADIANAYANELIQGNLQRKYDSSAYARDFISSHLIEVRQRLEQSERALNDYSRKAGLIHLAGSNTSGSDGKSSGGQSAGSVTTSSLEQINQAANDATAKRIAAEADWSALNSVPLMSAPAVINNPAIASLQNEKVTLQAALQEEESRHLEDYPTVKSKLAELASVNQQIQQAANNIRNAARAQYEAAIHTEDQLNRQVAQLKVATLSEQDNNVEYGMLSREVDTNREIYDGLLQRFKQLNASAGISLSNVSVIDTAEAPVVPSSPSLIKNLLLALVIGSAIAGMVVFAKDQLDDSIRVPEDIESKLGLALLGVIPSAGEGEPTEQLNNPKSPIAEAFNSLRGALLYSTSEGLPHVLLVTSAQASEGKTTTSFALASAIARMGKKVALIDADMRRPTLHRRIKDDNSRGLSTLLVTQDAAETALKPSGQANLSLLTSGPVPPSPTELLSSGRLEAILQELARTRDVVILDSPPVLGLADAPTIAALADGVIFVVEADRSRNGALKAALRRLRAVRPIVLGAVLTKFDPLKGANRYSTYYGSEYYQYEPGS